MKKIDRTVISETYFIAEVSLMFSLGLQCFFFAFGKWDYTVLLGNLLGLLAAVGNFFLLGLTLQNALEKDEESVKTAVKASQSLRLLGLFVVALIGYLLPVFNIIAVVIPYLFPRIAIGLRPVFRRRGD